MAESAEYYSDASRDDGLDVYCSSCRRKLMSASLDRAWQRTHGADRRYRMTLVALDGGSRAERQAAEFVRERVGGAVRTPRTYAERERAARVQAHADRIARAMERAS